MLCFITPILNIFHQLTPLEIVFLIILLLAFLDQIFFYLLYSFKLKKYPKSDSEKSVLNPISVIICAKNEDKNLENFLPKILEQEYPEFEVIIVNDASTDNSKIILDKLKVKYENLKIINLDYSKGKKHALTTGIKESISDNLVFTDADCYPSSTNWLKLISSKFSNEKQIILGYGAYEKKYGLLNEFIRYDTFLIAIQYFTAATMGFAYMGVGRNLAYNKKIWKKVNGFENHMNILSGDDDLFISEASDYNNTTICLEKGSFTYSIPKKNILEFIKQKSRHISTSSKYKPISILFSSGELISRSVFYITLITLFFFNNLTYLLILTYLSRIFFIYLVNLKLRKKLNNKILFFYFTLFDILAPFFYCAVFFFKLFNNKYKQW